MLVSLSVNGAPSELLVEPDALTWWRSSDKAHGQQGESPIRQLARHLSSASINRQQQTTPTSIVTTPTMGASPGRPSDGKRKQVDFSQIIGLVKVPSRRRQKGASDSSKQEAASQSHISKLKVYFARRREHKFSGRLLKLKKLVIELPPPPPPRANHQTSSDQLANLADLIEQHLELVRRQRPRKLLIFVNPFGGKGKAVHLFERKVKRVLELADIGSELVVTEYANPDFNVDQFDGIICIGGDGMFGELMNGLLFRFNRDKLQLRNRPPAAEASAPKQPRELAKSTDSSSDLDSLGGSGGSSPSSSSRSSSKIHDDDDDLGIGARVEVLAQRNDKRNLNDGNNNNNNSNAVADQANCDHHHHHHQRQQQQQQNGIAQRTATAQATCCAGTLRQQVDFLRASLGGIGERFYSPTMPIGVIGAGSTDANLFGFIGTNDVISATLNIVLGNQIQIDVCSAHSIRDDRLLRFVSTFVAYGYFGDVARESEKLRWLGPSRYDVTAVNSLIKYRHYPGLVRILSSPRDGSPRDPDRCHLECRLCGNSNNISSSLSFNDLSRLSKSQEGGERAAEVARGPPTEAHNHGQHHNQLQLDGGGGDDDGSALHDPHDHFQIIERRGPFLGVNAAVTACRCPKTHKGFSPGNHLANGCADLILVRPCSRMQYINYLIRTGYTSKSAFDLDYVEAYRCRQFEFIAEPAAAPAIARSKGRGAAAAASQLSSLPADGANDENSTITSGYGSSSTIKQQSSRESCSSSAGDSLSSRHQRATGASPLGELPREHEHEHEHEHKYELGHKCELETTGSSWNADGEILTEQSIRVKVNNKLLRVFGTGEPRQRRQKSRA